MNVIESLNKWKSDRNETLPKMGYFLSSVINLSIDLNLNSSLESSNKYHNPFIMHSKSHVCRHFFCAVAKSIAQYDKQKNSQRLNRYLWLLLKNVIIIDDRWEKKKTPINFHTRWKHTKKRRCFIRTNLKIPVRDNCMLFSVPLEKHFNSILHDFFFLLQNVF